MKRSLLVTLSLGLVVTLALVFGVQWSVMRGAVDAGMREFIAGELEQDADELFGSLVVQPGGEAVLALSHFDPAFLTPASGRYYQISVDGKVALRSPSLVYDSLPEANVPAGTRHPREATGPNGQALLLLASGYRVDDRPVTVLVGVDVAPVAEESRRLLARYTAITLALFGLLVLLQIVLVRVALAPLRRAEADVARLERGEMRQLSEAVPAEALPLVRAVNRLLALMTARLQRSRDSLGNVAHALKGPLTLLAQLAEDDALQRAPALRVQIAEQVEILRTRIDRELRRARVAGGDAVRAPLPLAAELDALVATVRKLHRERTLDVACRVDPDASVRADREDFLELFGNLLDNACKWARSRVRVTVTDHGRTVVSIEDDGPGCPEEDLQRIAERGVRLDEAAAGHGLGLAIARDIAVSYEAELELGRSGELGGFRATVRFPAIAAAPSTAVETA